MGYGVVWMSGGLLGEILRGGTPVGVVAVDGLPDGAKLEAARYDVNSCLVEYTYSHDSFRGTADDPEEVSLNFRIDRRLQGLLEGIPRNRMDDLRVRAAAGRFTAAEELAFAVLKGDGDGSATSPLIDAAIEEYGHGSYRVPVRHFASWDTVTFVVHPPHDLSDDERGRALAVFQRLLDDKNPRNLILMPGPGWSVDVYDSDPPPSLGTADYRFRREPRPEADGVANVWVECRLELSHVGSLPPDARLVDSVYMERLGQLWMRFTHPSFPATPPGTMIPWLNGDPPGYDQYRREVESSFRGGGDGTG